MRPLFVPLLLAMLLAGCSVFHQAAAPVGRGGAATAPTPAAYHAGLIFNEAHRLAGRVEQGELTRLQAADALNQYRLRLVGANRVDDSTFATYRHLAQKRDQGLMSAEESHARMEARLRDWQRRWPRLPRRPADPAFTNFLMQLYDLPYLTAVAP